MAGTNNRFQLVIDRLVAGFGESHETCDGVASWTLGPGEDRAPVRVACEPLEDGCARVWIFDPSADRDGQVQCLRVVTRAETDSLMAELQRRLTRRTGDAPRQAAKAAE